MFKCLQILCAKYYELRYMFKKLHLVKFGAFSCYSIKIRVIFGVRFERRKAHTSGMGGHNYGYFRLSVVVKIAVFELAWSILPGLHLENNTNIVFCSSRAFFTSRRNKRA